MIRSIFFTDLDGTLIDFETYSPAIATPLAQNLIKQGNPLIFCSSKTLEEQKSLMLEMDIATPCIVENGCGIYVPQGLSLFEDAPGSKLKDGGRLISFGVPSTVIRDAIVEVSNTMRIDFKPYSNLSDKEIANATGLSQGAASRARNRDFSETLTTKLPREIWDKFDSELNKVGLQCVFGGRFYTVTARNCSKGSAICATMKAYRKNFDEPWVSIGIGDSSNDIEMLLNTDLCYLVQRPDGMWNQMNVPNLRRIPEIGPKGWIQAVEESLSQLSQNE